MRKVRLEKQEAQPIDDATMVAIEAAREQVRRGQTITMEQARKNARKRYQAWREAQEEILPAA